MKRYRQLAFEDRVYIEVLRWERRSLSYIASRLKVAPSTVSRELARGSTGWLQTGYRADHGENRRRQKARDKGRKRKITGELERIVLQKLKLGWSPEQISGRLKLEGIAQISHETIYRFIERDKLAGGSLFRLLRHGRRVRKKRFYVPRIQQKLLNRRSIETRPEIINERRRTGDWERDLMFGDSRRAALMTFVERRTRYTILKRIESKSPELVAQATIEAMSGVRCLSLTNDNGFEFRAHEKEAQALSIPIYFTHPYSSWEKGTCENINGLIRQYFAKGSSIQAFDSKRALQVQTALNTRPRKSLGFLTPMEAFFRERFALFL